MSQPVATVGSTTVRPRRLRAAAGGVALTGAIMVAMMLAPAAFAGNADDAPVTMQIAVGYQGVVPTAGDMPVQVNVANKGADLTATLVITAGKQSSSSIGGFAAPAFYGSGGVVAGPAIPCCFGGGPTGTPVTWREQVQLPAGTTKHFEAFLPSSSRAVSAQVIAASGPRKGKSLATVQATPTGGVQGLGVLVVSGDTSALTELGSVQMQDFSGQQGVVRAAPANLPDSAAALGAFSLVIVDNAATDGLTAGQKAALESYVTSGGNLAVTGGDAWHQTMAGVPTDLLALTPSGTQTLPGLAGSASQLGVGALAGTVDVATGALSGGAVVALAEGTAPIIAQATHGAGRIFYVTPDLDAAPVASWPGTLTLLRQLMVQSVGQSGWSDGATSPAANVAVQGGSIYQALANIPSLELPSPASIAVILVVFILLVGPANYVLLHRLHRPDFAWVTIPLLVAISAGAIYGFGLSQKGTNVLADRVRLVYVQAGSNTAFVSAGTGVFSPHAGNHTVSTSSGSTVAPLSSGQSSGAMTISAGPPQSVLLNWTKADSIETFGESYAQQMSGGLSEHLAVVNGRLQGTVTNNLAETIDDAVALSGSSYQRFAKLRPGASATVNLPLPSTAVVTATASSLANQAYLHTPATCPLNKPCNSTPASENAGARPTASQRQAERRAQVLNGILGNNPFDATQPLFLGWAESPAGPVLVDGHPAGLDELDAFVLPLQAAITAGTLPVGAVPAQIIDGTGPNPSYLSAGIGTPYMQPGTTTTQEFALPGASWAHLSLTMTKVSTSMIIGGRPPTSSTPTAAIFNFSSAKWEPIGLPFGATVAIANIGQHVSPGGLVLVRLSAPNTGLATQAQLDISGQEAGAA